MTGTDDHVRRNRAAWDGWAATLDWARQWPSEEVWKARKIRRGDTNAQDPAGDANE